MTIKIEKRNVGPLSLRAGLSPDSVNKERRTVDLVWTTGAKVLRTSWSDGPFYEELSLEPAHVRMDRLNNGAPFLADHDGGSVSSTLGVVESARIERGQGIATIRFAAEGIDPEADKVFRKIQDGIIQNVSVGYRIHAVEKVSGGEKIPTFRVIDWTPHEISAVAMGADDGAGFRSAAPTNEVSIHTSQQEQNKMDPEEIKRQAAELEAKRAAEVKAATEAAVTAERERVSSIQLACRAASLDNAVSDKMIADGITADQARTLALNELAKRSDEIKTENHVRVTGVAGGDERDKFVRGVSAWVFEKSGNGLVAQAKARGVAEFANIETDGGQFRGMSLIDIARECCARSNISLRGVYEKRKVFELALSQRAGGSTGDFAVLFENVMYKQMRASYAVQADSWRRWCGVEKVQDFKPSNRYLNGSFGTLPVVSENGEYTNATIPDGSKISIATETRGQIIGLSRQAMINDDLGALLDVAVRFGKAAGNSIETAAYDMLALNTNLGPTMSDSQPYFHSNRSNVSTSAALSVAALDADRVKMRTQMDPDGNNYLDLNPSILLIPVGLESAARILNESAVDHTAALDGKPNVVRGMFSDIVSSPRLGSTTRRFLFTANKEAFKVVFLEGAGEGPTMESEDGFRVDGTEWKARIDFKVNAYDPKTAITNAGT